MLVFETPDVVEDHAEDEEGEEEEGGPSGSLCNMDPSYAAKCRAYHRMQAMEDTSLPDDVRDAEEDCDVTEQMSWDMGFPIEPFNLRRERELGYFDADGNYIEYRLDKLEKGDAWLDNLKDDVDVDEALAQRLLNRVEEVSPPALDEDSIVAYKKRIINLLLPGESISDALRRLGRRRNRDEGYPHRARRHKRPQAAALAPPGHKTDQEQGQSGAGPPQGEGARRPSQALNEENGARSSTIGSTPHSTPSISSALPEDNRIAFDKLTEYADLLLSHGHYDIYNIKKELLEKDVWQHEEEDRTKPQGSAGVDGDAGPSSSGAVRRNEGGPCVSAEGVPDSHDELTNRMSLDGGEPRTSEDRAVSQEDIGGKEEGTAGPRSAEEWLASWRAPGGEDQEDGDDDIDMFGGDVDDGHRPRWGGESERGRDDVMNEASRAGGGHRAASSQNTVGNQDDVGEVAVGGAAGAVVDGVQKDEGQVEEVESVLAGFKLDEGSGYYYNSDLGYYYDPVTSLFGDAASGMWYRYISGRYELVA